jgi:hypothetical protein
MEKTFSTSRPHLFGEAPYDEHLFFEQLTTAVANMRFHPHHRREIIRESQYFGSLLRSKSATG